MSGLGQFRQSARYQLGLLKCLFETIGLGIGTGIHIEHAGKFVTVAFRRFLLQPAFPRVRAKTAAGEGDEEKTCSAFRRHGGF